MRKFLSKILIFSLAFSLAGCASNTPRENTVIGATTGAAAGTALGAASGPTPGFFTLVGTGAIVGALIGSSFEVPMESCDKEKAYQAIAAGKTATWQNPTSKISYTIIPAAHFTKFHGNPDCRQFIAIQTNRDGNRRKIYRTACREANGNWQLAH